MDTRQAVALPDTEYAAMLLKAKMAGKRGYKCYDKKGNKHRFFMKEDVLWGIHDNKEYEVMSMTDAMAKNEEIKSRAGNAFKESVKSKMRVDFPDMSEEELDANADIVSEANEAIKRLIASGTPPDVAYKVIMGTLHSDEANNLIIKELSERDTKTD